MNLRIELLNKDNYDTWKIQVHALLIKNEGWVYVNGSSMKPEEEAECKRWEAADEKAKADLILAISPSELKNVRGCKTSRDIWLKLESIYASKGPAKKATLLKQLALQKMREGDDVREHMSKFFEAVDKLSDMNVDIHDDLLSILLLYSLPASYENFRCAMETRDQLPKVDFLKIKISEEDSSRKQSTSLDIQGAMNVNRRQVQSRKEVFRFKCFKCHTFGHKASECQKKNKRDTRCATTEKRKEEQADSNFGVMNCEPITCQAVGISRHDWIVDSGCTSHLCNDRNKFDNTYVRTSGKLNLANKLSTNIQGKGNLRFSACNNNSNIEVLFRNALYVPDLRSNLISVSKLTDSGYVVTFERNVALIADQNGVVRMTADRKGDLYHMREQNAQASTVCYGKNVDVWSWHERMGHLNARDLMKVLKESGIDVKATVMNELYKCDICAKGKMSSLPFSRTNGPCNEKLKIIHSDVVGPMRVESIGGAKYFVTFIDDSTRWCEVYLLAQKSKVLDAFKVYKNYVEKQTGKKIKILQTDNGGEYRNHEFDDFLVQQGIQRRLTVARTPQQNGVAERMNRTLVEMARCMMLSSGLSAGFWAEAVVTACHVRNRCPSSSLEGNIPYVKWHDTSMRLGHLRNFGAKVFVLDKAPGKDKFAARAKEGTFVGYPREEKGYRVWIPAEMKIVIARDVKFLEDKSKNSCKIDPFENYGLSKESETNEERKTVDVEILPAEKVVVECEDRHSETTDEDRILKRAPGRPRFERTGERGRPRKIYRMVEVDSETDYDTADDATEIGGTAEISLKDALSSSDSKGWEEAIFSEITSLIKNDTWEITNSPKDQNIVDCRYVLTEKLNVDKTVKKKARLVAKGFSQRYGVDYHRTFAPVARLQTVRLLIALAAELNMVVHQLDINTAFLNGQLDEEVYMKVPQLLQKGLHKILGQEDNKSILGKRARLMLKDLEAGGDVCRLKRALYGLKQAGRQWYLRLDEKLQQMKLKPTLNEPCMYHTRRDDCTILIVVIYVDDILVASQDEEWIKSFKHDLGEEFELKDFGLAKYCLGIEIDKNEKGFLLSQRKYINDILKKFNMEESNTVSTPMEVGVKFENIVEGSKEQWPYRELIGALMYLSTGTRPDIAHTVSKLAQFTSCPAKVHWGCAKRVLRYLKKTINLSLVYRNTNKPLQGFSDADWGNCLIDRCSYSGYVYLLGGAAISWKSQKQKSVATSSTEAEYVSMSEAMKEAVYLKSVLTEIGLTDMSRVVFYADNQGAIYLANDPVFHSRSKHIDIRFHFIRDVIKDKHIVLKYLSTDNMIADVLTKALPSVKHYICVSGLGLMQC